VLMVFLFTTLFISWFYFLFLLWWWWCSYFSFGQSSSLSPCTIFASPKNGFLFQGSICGPCEFTRPRKICKTKKWNLFFELAKLKQEFSWGFEINFLKV
jgi:hypothetical protein